MPSTPRLDTYQRRHGWLGFPLAVVYKFVDDQGGYLAALITYYAFVSLFPLLLLAVTVLGFALSGDVHLQQRVLGSALQQFPIVGSQLGRNVASLRGSGAGLAVGLIGTVYGGLGVAQALQNALNRVWTVPRNRRPNPIMSRLRSLGLLAVLGAGVVLTSVLSALSSAARSYGAELGVGVRVLLVVAAVLVNVALFLAAFRALTARSVSTRQVLPGALIAGVSWQLLQSVGTYYVGNTLRGATEIYGLFGLVLGLVAWLHLEALVVVLSAEVNVVLARRLWPRSLLTPFTDNVALTPADQEAYRSYADTETYKGFEEVTVTFDPAHASAVPAGGETAEPIPAAEVAPIKE
ncbi:MAG: hypothetical protein NVSMB13_14420 [Mycobacteriales bacterium]